MSSNASPLITPAASARPTFEVLASVAPALCPKPASHIVTAGDTLWGIAQQHDVTVNALLVANPQISDPRLLRVGDEVIISPVDLGTLKGRRSLASDINDRGEIVGQSETELGPPWDPAADTTPMYEVHAFLWRDGAMRDLGSTGGWSAAPRLNERGEVVGGSNETTNDGASVRAYVWRDGARTTIGPPIRGRGGPSINDLGQIALTTTEPDPEDPALERWHPLLWEDGQTRSLEPLSDTVDINDRGQVVGRSGGHAALWSAGIVTDLGTLGGETSGAEAINERGQVVGWSDTKSGDTHAFFWSDGTMTDLGTLGGAASAATGINDRGQVVGWSDTASGGERAFLWEDGTMRELGTLASAPDSRELGPTYVSAAAINDCGQVVGSDYRPYVVDGRALLWFVPAR